MCGSAKKDSRSGTDKLLSAISLNLGEGTDNLTRWQFNGVHDTIVGLPYSGRL